MAQTMVITLTLQSNGPRWSRRVRCSFQQVVAARGRMWAMLAISPAIGRVQGAKSSTRTAWISNPTASIRRPTSFATAVFLCALPRNPKLTLLPLQKNLKLQKQPTAKTYSPTHHATIILPMVGMFLVIGVLLRITGMHRL